MAVTEISTIHHVALVFLLLWLLNSFRCCHPLFYLLSLIYLYQVHERCLMKLSRKFQYDERKQANQRRVLLGSESVRWLNHAIEKIWPICMEDIVSQKILLPIIPWFLDKYKPWTVSNAEVQHLYLGRNPPMFTEMRVLRQPTDDDHLVLELGLNFFAADDMNAILTAKLQKALGFGISTKLHMSCMHVEGKVLVGVKFIRRWPFISRLRVCFAEPPYFQMNVKPIFSQGLDVSELPGIAGWLDNLLAVAFEQTLVEPNMLVVHLEKFVSPEPENWFSMDVKDPIAYARVEIIEASNLKPSDPNGLADPYVKGQLGPYRFKTKIHRKTLNPKFHEDYKIPICSWESVNLLDIEVRDKDPFLDDNLGVCSININHLRDGQRHDMWVPLEKIKMGRLHLAITVVDSNANVYQAGEGGKLSTGDKLNAQDKSPDTGLPSSVPLKTNQKVADVFEPIDIQGQKETGIWVHHPGSEISQKWEPRKGKKSRQPDTEIMRENCGENSVKTPDSSLGGSSPRETNCSNKMAESKKPSIFQMFSFGRHKQQQNSKREENMSSFSEPASSPHANMKPVNSNRIGVRLVVDDSLCGDVDMSKEEGGGGGLIIEGSKREISTPKEQAKGETENMSEQGGKSEHAFSNKGSKHFSRSQGVAREREAEDVYSESFDK